jgi:flagellar motor switch protein FliM
MSMIDSPLMRGLERVLDLSSFRQQVIASNLANVDTPGYLRIVFECGLVSAEHLTYREFLQRIPEKTYLASCNLSPVDVAAVLQIDLAVVFPIIDLLLGGEGTGGDLGREITEIEEQVLESVVRIVCRELQNTWQAISLVFEFGQRQAVNQAQRLMPPEEKNLCLSFEVKMSDTRGTMNLAVPAVVSNALLRKIADDSNYQRPRNHMGSRRQIENKLLDCPFQVELSAPDLEVSLQTLAEMVPGTILSFPRLASVPATLLVESIRLATAMPARLDDRRAARVVALEAANPAGEA